MCRHPMLRENPIIPVAYFLHERKFQSTHKAFFKVLEMKFPTFKESNIIVITDREKAMINAISKTFVNSTSLVCRNHIFRNFGLVNTMGVVTTQELMT